MILIALAKSILRDGAHPALFRHDPIIQRVLPLFGAERFD